MNCLAVNVVQKFHRITHMLSFSDTSMRQWECRDVIRLKYFSWLITVVIPRPCRCHCTTLTTQTLCVCELLIDAKVQCNICMEDFQLDEPVRTLPCKHFYHPVCISTWLQLVSANHSAAEPSNPYWPTLNLHGNVLISVLRVTAQNLLAILKFWRVQWQWW